MKISSSLVTIHKTRALPPHSAGEHPLPTTTFDPLTADLRANIPPKRPSFPQCTSGMSHSLMAAHRSYLNLNLKLKSIQRIKGLREKPRLRSTSTEVRTLYSKTRASTPNVFHRDGSQRQEESHPIRITSNLSVVNRTSDTGHSYFSSKREAAPFSAAPSQYVSTSTPRNDNTSAENMWKRAHPPLQSVLSKAQSLLSKGGGFKAQNEGTSLGLNDPSLHSRA